MTSGKTAVGVAVIGVGRMGREHARIYAGFSDVHLVGVVDADQERRESIADEFGCGSFADVESLMTVAGPPTSAANSESGRIVAVSIAVPTAHHAAVAAPLIERGVACLIEKPLAADPHQARSLAELARQHGTTLQVGHTERFNPAVRAVAAMDITPRFMEVNRVSPMTFRSLDVGVVMDMMIHDLDIVLMLADSPLKQVDATGVAVLGDHEDVANARVVFESGCVANLTASRLALKTERKMRLFSEQAYVSLDHQKRSGLVIRKSGNVDALAHVRQQIAEGVDLTDLNYSHLVQVDQLEMDGADTGEDSLTAELSSFLDAVRTGRCPDVDGAAGYAAVDAAHRVVHSLRGHRWEGLVEPRV